MSQLEPVDNSDWLFDLKHHLIALGELYPDGTCSERLKNWLLTAFAKEKQVGGIIANGQYWACLSPRIREERMKSLYCIICDEIENANGIDCIARLNAYQAYINEQRLSRKP